MYLGRDTATDVIAFDNSVKKGELLADIAISTDTAIRNARSFKTNPLDEVRLYIIHGVLHLLGYDDNNGRNALIMRERQELLWQSIKPRQ